MGVNRVVNSFTRISSALIERLKRKPSEFRTQNSRNKYKKDEYSQQEHQTENGRRFTYTSIIGIMLILFITSITWFRGFTGADSPQCRPIYMYPSYAKIDGFDLRYTPLAQKYHLYLYREQGKDKDPINGNEIQLDGVPVLFIPGNAGSFKQARSIAAESANIYFTSRDILDNQINTRNLDFFTADFNEDFTAFHGKTLLDQAEYLNDAIAYILSLYEENNNDDMVLPESVIILAHSMGGIVARVMMTLENHLPGSINSVLTLSTPHAAAPITFDGDVLKIYKKTDEYWSAQLSDEDSFFSRNVSLISITGGISDEILPADYATVADLIPPENGFTTFTTTIPNVWTPIDHLAIVWCKQLRHVIAKLLLEMVDVNSHSKTRSLKERVDISRNLLLSGFEDYASDDSILKQPDAKGRFTDTTYDFDIPIIAVNETLLITKNNHENASDYSKIIIPHGESTNNLDFNFLTTFQKPNILLCKTPPGLESASDMKCVPGGDAVLTVPSSLAKTKFPADSSWDEETEPFKMINIQSNILSLYDFLIIEKPRFVLFSDSSFIFASLSETIAEETLDFKPQQLLWKSVKLSAPAESNTYTMTWNFPNLWNSLIAYQLEVSSPSSVEKTTFEPFIRQWTFEPFETKWHVNIIHNHYIDISMHNVSPFIPIDETQSRKLAFTLTRPPNVDMSIKLRVNWYLTFRLLFIRYRLAIASFLAAFVSLVLAYQFYNFRVTSEFVGFETGMNAVLKKFGILIFVFLIMLNPIVNIKIIQRILFVIDPVGLNDPFLLEENNIHNNYYYLGTRDLISCWIGVIFGLMTLALLYIICKISSAIELSCHYITNKYSNRSEKEIMRITENKSHENMFDRRRLFAFLMLITLVTFYIPYQLAFVIGVLIQLCTCIKTLLKPSLSDPMLNRRLRNLRNYNISILLLFLIVTIIDTPIIIVFMHNVAIKWETTFRSHHNVLAILPILLLIVSNSRMRLPNYSDRIIDWYIIVGLFIYLFFFSMVYGIRNLFWIHHAVNIISGWLFYGSLTA